MRLRAEIFGVESQGDVLLIRAQATEAGSAEWRAMLKVTFQLSDTARNRKALHVGRLLRVTIEPARGANV